MKNNYQRLSKEEKKKISDEYFSTKIGKYVKRKLTSAFICGIFCIIISIFLIIKAKFRKKQKGRLTFVKQPFLPSNKIHKNHKLIVNHRKYF